MITLSIAKDFSKKPGFRYKSQSPTTSGEQFRDDLLEPKYLEALHKNVKLRVILDGTDGYLTSFIEEAFGGLQRKHKANNILDTIEIISVDEKHWIDEIYQYVHDEIEK